MGDFLPTALLALVQTPSKATNTAEGRQLLFISQESNSSICSTIISGGDHKIRQAGVNLHLCHLQAWELGTDAVQPKMTVKSADVLQRTKPPGIRRGRALPVGVAGRPSPS